MAVKYPPYVDYAAGIPVIFNAIKKASVPEKFTNDFLKTVLGLKSSSYQAMIPFLKRIGFIDAATNAPTQAYKDFRDNDTNKAGAVMASKLKEAFPEIFSSNEFAYKLDKKEIASNLITRLGVSADDKTVPKVAVVFTELAKLSNFENKSGGSAKKTTKITLPDDAADEDEVEEEEKGKKREPMHRKLGISYTINLNLPATDNVEVFNAIFKSLKENILNEK